MVVDGVVTVMAVLALSFVMNLSGQATTIVSIANVHRPPFLFTVANMPVAEGATADLAVSAWLTLAVSSEPAVEGTAVVEDEFLREPVEGGVLRHREARAHVASFARARAVGAFGGLRRERGMGVGADMGGDVEPVAAGDAAGGVDEDGLQAVLGAGEEGLEGA